MSENSPVTIYTTFTNGEEASAVARALLDAKLIACANIMSDVHSIYRWKGEICDEREVAVFMKTRIGRVDRVLSMIEELHSYEAPVIEVLPVFAANAALKSFVVDETGE